MKFRSYNDKEHIPQECGSFSVVSRSINNVLKKRGLYNEDLNDPNNIVLVPECLDTQQKFINHIPYLASEYSLPPNFVLQWLYQYAPNVITISEFSKQNLINGGYPADKIFKVHLGSDPDFYKPIKVPKFDTFTFLTVNSSNDRSALPELAESFVEFSKDKNVRLIIKDGKNERFAAWVKSLNCNKIIYCDARLDPSVLRLLYNQVHIHLYYNHSTSFGLNICDSALCGTPSLVTLGSAPKEFIPEWTQPVKVRTELKPLDAEIINQWNSIGLNTPPVGMYPQGTMRECIKKEDIIPALEYAYNHYDELKDINIVHRDHIIKNYTWDHMVDNLIKTLENIYE